MQAEKNTGDQTPTGRKKYIFKSKFARDQITLQKPMKEIREDGSKVTRPARYAEFFQHTWSTYDALMAKVLRDQIAERINTNPLGISETTDLEPIRKPGRPKKEE